MICLEKQPVFLLQKEPLPTETGLQTTIGCSMHDESVNYRQTKYKQIKTSNTHTVAKVTTSIDIIHGRLSVVQYLLKMSTMFGISLQFEGQVSNHFSLLLLKLFSQTLGLKLLLSSSFTCPMKLCTVSLRQAV